MPATQLPPIVLRPYWTDDLGSEIRRRFTMQNAKRHPRTLDAFKLSAVKAAADNSQAQLMFENAVYRRIRDFAHLSQCVVRIKSDTRRITHQQDEKYE